MEEENKNESELVRGIKLYLMRNRLNVREFCENVTKLKDAVRAESLKPILKDVVLSILNRDK